jgi:Bacteriophage Mu Gam like protein
MTQLTDIEARAKAYSDARAEVAAIVTELNDSIESLKRAHMPGLKRSIAKVAERHDRLKGIIDANPQLFVRPKTVVMHGVKIGYAKGKGGITFDDPSQVVKLIKKHLPEQADVLIITKESPAKDALAQLSAQDLKKIGCTVVNTGDQVVIKPADSEVDKLVDTLIKGATETEADAS